VPRRVVSGKRKVVCCLWFVIENNAIQSAKSLEIKIEPRVRRKDYKKVKSEE